MTHEALTILQRIGIDPAQAEEGTVALAGAAGRELQNPRSGGGGTGLVLLAADRLAADRE
jgi:hypothetical protein